MNNQRNTGVSATPRRYRYSFDVTRWAHREEALADLCTTLPLPDYCGANLDALADALWELPPCDIELKGGLSLNEDGPLGTWGVQLRRMFVDVSLARGADLDVILSH